ncbi:MAG: response regulator, partial [Deltaproteobacteria bacterium]|nr:response regulator [Deltaproteobacteria bacterium]
METKQRVLIAEDGRAMAKLLELTLERWGYEPLVVGDGAAAWDVLRDPTGPRLAIVDWEMPGMDGPEICQRVRQANAPYVYIILLTAKKQLSDVVAGLQAGADDFVTKPFEDEELRSRLRTGQRILALEAGLAQKVAELEQALGQVNTLEGLIPICMYCKRIRNSDKLWEQVERYLEQ